MALSPGDQWLGYAPAMVGSHKYVVAYHPKLGFRVAVRIPERERSREITLFCLDPHPEIEDQIKDGGPFFVNEWKQVLKPLKGEEGYRKVTYLGELPDLRFRFRYHDRIFDNSDTAGLQPGDPWPHQETGMMYKYDLSRSKITREIVEWEDFASTETTEDVPSAPPHLLSALEKAKRGQRAGRFYVNEHGVVFAPIDEAGLVGMTYVGRLDLARDPWFPKYEGEGP